MFNFFNKSKKLEKILTKANMDFEFFPGKVDKVKKLIEGGADVNALSEADQTALHFACRDRDRIENVVEFVNFLIDKGANVNAGTISESTPLIMAAREGSLDLVKILVEAGADVNLENDDGDSPMKIALETADDKTSLEIKKYLISKGATEDKDSK